VNPFIVKNAARMSELYTRLTTSPSGDIEECFASDSDTVFTNITEAQLALDYEAVRITCVLNLM